MSENHINKIIYSGTTLIDLTEDTITTSDLAYGKTAHDKYGAIIIGTNTNDSNTTNATASASEILATKTAYVNKNKIVGEMPNRGGVTGTIDTVNGEYTIQNGFHDGSGKVAIDSVEQNKIVAGNIKSGVTILGVEGSYTGESISVEANKNVTPSSSQQIITPTSPTYDYLAQVTVAPIPYAETPNSYGITVTIG